MKKLILSSLALLAMAGLALAEVRTWTQASTGKTLEGELSRVNGDKILIIRPGGSSLELPVAMLTDADKQYIADFQKGGAADAPAAEDAGSEEAMALPAGETELVLEDAHACCKGCYSAIEGALGTLTGVEISASKNTIEIKGETGDLVKTALGYVMGKGFYGKPSIAAFADQREYETDEIEEIYISKVHVCCNSCIKDLEEALDSVDGVEDYSEITKKVAEVHVQGKFTQAEIMAALHEQGYHASLSPRAR